MVRVLIMLAVVLAIAAPHRVGAARLAGSVAPAGTMVMAADGDMTGTAGSRSAICLRAGVALCCDWMGGHCSIAMVMPDGSPALAIAGIDRHRRPAGHDRRSGSGSGADPPPPRT